jgi:hypothetical protein
MVSDSHIDVLIDFNNALQVGENLGVVDSIPATGCIQLEVDTVGRIAEGGAVLGMSPVGVCEL